MRRKELEERLIYFSSEIIKLSNNLNYSPAGKQLADQLARSGSSASLNYGEAQGAESKKDFIHKMGISLKELRETQICLKLIKNTFLSKNEEIVNWAISESDELISIFVVSLRTAKNNIIRTS